MENEKRPITVDDLYNIAYIEDPRISPDGQWIAYVHMTVDRMDNGYKRNLWLVSTGTGQRVQITRSGKDSQPRWSPDGGTLAFVSARDEKPQIYLLPINGPGEARALTGMPNGATTPEWSPDGSQIAFLAGMNAAERAKEDSGEDDPKPANKFEAKQQKERKEFDEKQRWDPRIIWRIPYRAGTSYLDDRYGQIYVMPVAEGDDAKPRRLTDVDADHAEPAWSPDGKYIYTDRAAEPDEDEPWRFSSIYRIRVEDGTNEQLTDLTYSDYNPLPSPDGKWIAYVRFLMEQSSRANVRLTLLPTAGGEPRDLTVEFDRSVELYRWQADSSALIFTAASWGNTEVYRAPVAGGAIEKITGGGWQADGLDVDSSGGVAYTASTPEHPSELYWHAPGAAESTRMTEANDKFLAEVIVQKTHEMRWNAPDGTEIQGWYLFPVGYEQGKTYPLALNIHGGPHVMWGPGAKTMFHEWQFHAARGYAVFYCNPRGGDGYGEAFRDGIFGGWGEKDMPDVMSGLDALLSMGFVDEKRMAVTGGSYGGFMTAWVVGHTDRFAAAVSQRGVYNLASFFGTTDIPTFVKNEFGFEPWENPEKLWTASPMAYAHTITTPLLIIHSENDFRVPVADGEQLFAFIKRSGGTVKLVRFPVDGHELSRSGQPEHRVARLTHMVDWFDRYCKE